MRRTENHDRKAIAATLIKLGIRTHSEPEPVSAYVNHDRWVADCYCGGAEIVTEGEPMTCGSCGAIREVIWPDAVAELEAELGKRDDPRTRNWYPHETVEDLQRELERHQ